MTVSPTTPHTPDRILVPLDGSAFAEQALPYALALAGHDTELVLLRVEPSPSPIRDAFGQVIIAAEEVGRWDEEQARRELDAAANVRGPGQPVRTVLVPGDDPAAAILDVAGAEQVRLIVLAGHGRGTAGRVAFGSVTDRVARSAAQPVLIVRGEEGAPESDVPGHRQAVLRRLLVPLDGSDLALAAIPLVRDWATRLHLTVQLITVLDPSSMASAAAAYAAAFSEDLTQKMFEGMRQAADEMLSAVAGDLLEAGVAAHWEIRQGEIGGAIAAATRPGDLIVLASHGRGGVTRWLLGSVAERLIRIAPVPVVVVPVPGRGQARREAPPASTVERMTELLHTERYRPTELAALLGVDVNLIRSEAFAGRLPAEIIDHHIVRIHRDDVLRWLAARG